MVHSYPAYCNLMISICKDIVSKRGHIPVFLAVINLVGGGNGTSNYCIIPATDPLCKEVRLPQPGSLLTCISSSGAVSV